MPNDLANFRPDGKFAAGNIIARDRRPQRSLMARFARRAAETVTDQDIDEMIQGMLAAAKQGDVSAYLAFVGKAAAEAGMFASDDGLSEEEKIAALRGIARKLMGINVEVTRAHSEPLAKP